MPNAYDVLALLGLVGALVVTPTGLTLLYWRWLDRRTRDTGHVVRVPYDEESDLTPPHIRPLNFEDPVRFIGEQPTSRDRATIARWVESHVETRADLRAGISRAVASLSAPSPAHADPTNGQPSDGEHRNTPRKGTRRGMDAAE